MLSNTATMAKVLRSRQEEDYRIQLFIPVLDRINSDLERRFSDENCDIVRGLFALPPGDETFLNSDSLNVFASNYSTNIS